MNIILIIAGIVLLFFGRKLFWLLVGAAGFLVGYHAAGVFADPQEQTALIVAIVFGLAGALLALFMQKIAILIGGFLAGGFVLMKLLAGVVMPEAIPYWLPFIIGGLLGAWLLKSVFEWALIALTSLLGATMAVTGIDVSGGTGTVVIVILGLVGIVIQARSRSGKKS